MTRLRFAILIFFIFATTASCVKKADNPDTEPIEALLTYIEGTVTISLPDQKDDIEAKVGDILPEGAVIHTASQSITELLIREDSKLRIVENSSLRIDHCTKNSTDKSETVNLNLNKGHLYAHPALANDNSTFEIEVESISVGVRGTEFLVFNDSDSVTVATHEGTVYISHLIQDDSITALSKSNPQFMKEFEEKVNFKLELQLNEEYTVNKNDLTQYSDHITNIITKLDPQNIKKSTSRDSIDNLLAETDRELEKVSELRTRLTTKTSVSPERWKKTLFENHFNILNGLSDGNSETDEEKETIMVPVIKKIGSFGTANLQAKITALTPSGKYIYLVNNTEKLVSAFDVAKGKVSWQLSITDDVTFYNPAVILENKLILATTLTLYVIANGKIESTIPLTNGPTFWRSPVTVENTLYIPMAKNVVSYRDGTIKTLSAVPKSSSQYSISTYNGNLYMLYFTEFAHIIEYNLKTGNIDFESKSALEKGFSSPVVVGNDIYYIDMKNTAYKFADKSPHPQTITLKSGSVSKLIVVNNTLYFVGNNGSLYAIPTASFNSCKKIADMDSSPVVDNYLTKSLFLKDNTLYFSQDNGQLFIYDCSTGTKQDISVSKVPLIGTPFSYNGKIIVCDEAGSIYSYSMEEQIKD